MSGACARAEGVIARAIKIRHTAGDPSIVSRKPLASQPYTAKTSEQNRTRILANAYIPRDGGE